MSEEGLNAEERRMVEALGELAPAPLDVSEQRIWYEAGLRAGRRRARIWGVAAAAIVAIAAGVAVIRPKGQIVYVDRVVVQGIQAQKGDVAPVVASASESAGVPMDYVRLRDAVERRGMEALRELQGGGGMSQPAPPIVSPQKDGVILSPWDSINTKG